jgi:hypothetical protein
VRGHGAGISWTTWLRVVEIIHRSRRRNAAVRGRGPAQTRHVRTAADAVGPVITISRRLKRLRGGVARGVRRHRWSLVRRTAEARERRRRGCRRGARAGLREIPPNMRRDRSVPHVVVASGTRHVQRWQVTGRWNGHRMMRRGRRRVNRGVLGENPITRCPCSLFVLSQVGFRLCGGLLNGSRVMVLMTRQGRASSERLLTVRIWTLVRPFSRMYSAVSGQGRRIAERLSRYSSQ